METIRTINKPFNKRCPFLEEEDERVRRNPQLRDLETFINREERNMTSKGFPMKKSCKTRRFLDLIRRDCQNQVPQMDSEEEEELQNMELIRRCPRQLRETLMQRWGRQTEQLQKPHLWYTVVPLQTPVPVRPEEVKVVVNPLCHILLIKVTPRMRQNKQFYGVMDKKMTQLQEIHRIVTLPKTIRMEMIQVKLTQRGELIVLAPYKTGVQQRHIKKNLLKDLPFFQEEEQTWIPIPIKKTETTRRQLRREPFFRGGENLSETSSSSSSSSSSSESETETESENEVERLNFPFSKKQMWTESESETETETDTDSETETETESETESESEYESEFEKKMLQGRRHQQNVNIMEQLERINIRTSIKIQVQKFVQLLEKIFYPNIVMVKLARGCISGRFTEEKKKQVQVIVNIKFADFKSEEIKVRLQHKTQQPVLIVEGKKVRQMRQFGAALKYVRREIQLPQLFNVKKVDYRVLENGVIRIALPFLTAITGNVTGNVTGNITGPLRRLLGNRRRQHCQLLDNFCTVRRVNCPHMVNLISEMEEPRRLQGKCQGRTRRNWKVLTQRCRPTCRRC